MLSMTCPPILHEAAEKGGKIVPTGKHFSEIIDHSSTFKIVTHHLQVRLGRKDFCVFKLTHMKCFPGKFG